MTFATGLGARNKGLLSESFRQATGFFLSFFVVCRSLGVDGPGTARGRSKNTLQKNTSSALMNIKNN